MNKNIIKNKDKHKLLLKLSFGFTLLLIIFLLPQYSNKSYAASDEFCYLSDIEYIKEKSNAAGGHIIHLDSNDSDGKLTLKVNGEGTDFFKGICAWASSQIVYDLSSYDYDYFTAYVGVHIRQQDNYFNTGLKFFIYTSDDGDTWDKVEQTDAMYGWSEAKPIKVDIKDKKYLKLVADKNSSNWWAEWYDEAIYADAKLIKEGYEEDTTPAAMIKTVAEYDEIVKSYEGQEITGDYELALLQREFVKNAGYDTLQFFYKYKDEYKETIEWLMNDLENIRLYVIGGAPDGGSYYNSLVQLNRLYHTYKDDFTISEPTNNKWYPEMTKGYVYKKMAISLSLTHSTAVGYWAQINNPSNRSDALERYRIYKYLYDNGKFVVSARQDQTPWFEALQVEEMRYVMNNILDDEELIWLNEYTQKRIDAHPNEEEKYLQPHTYIAYVWPNFDNPIYHDPAKYEEWDELFEGIFSKYGVTYSSENNKVYKAWMSMRNKYGTGAVCGGISKLGTHIRAAHGMPASVIGQPGHAAIIYYRKDNNGYGYWSMDNDVSGWSQSGKSEKMGTRMPLGWGSDSYVNGYAATYIHLSQEALNDFANYQKAEEIIMTADLYKGNPQKQEEIYRSAIAVQPINIDAWWNLIKLYKSDEYKSYLEQNLEDGQTIEEVRKEALYNLASEISENMKCFPLPMYNLLCQIKPELTGVEYSFRYTLLETNALKTSSTLAPAEVYEPGKVGSVYSPSIARTVANFLLGQVDKTLATFSFDGADAGKIVLSSRYDNIGIRWDYSLDGKQNWTEISFTADEEHKLQLTTEQIASITAENDIYIHIVGTGYEEENLYKIDILDNVISEETLYGNDLENRVIGVNLSYEWRNSESENDSWTSYATSSPDNTGNKTLQVRQAANGTKLASNVLTFTFTEDNQPDTRKYIPVSHLSLHAVSTQATNNGGAAANALDANYNTRWHSAWNGTDTERYIVIKLDRSVVLSAVEFVPAGGGNGRIVDGTVYGSMDGETWEELSSLTGQTYSTQANTNEQAKTFTKRFEIADENRKEVQYVKIVADRTNGNWFAARAFNLYQDLTKNPHPTAGIAYDVTEPTNGSVIARLINPSTEITITNNGGKDTYVFTENGEFTFEFVDAKGNTGSAKAKVDWIDKKAPTVDINYGLNDDRKLLVILDNISKDAYLLDKDNNKINYIEVNEQTKKITNITYLDNEGNAYKTLDKDNSGNTTKITYKNTLENLTGNASRVATYITTLKTVADENEEIKIGEVINEEYFDNEGNAITNLTDAEKEELRRLQQTARSNPLEQALETSGEYEFKLVDKAGNKLYKNIKVDYIENSNTIIASDITYDITNLTNTDVVATINPYIIDTTGKHVSVEVISEGGKTHTFEENGTFTFEYKDSSDTENMDVKEHTAKVDWIDKVAPTAEVRYSTTESTDKAVTVTLINESEEIIITNNGASKEYIFTENGEFTFAFKDKAGNVGTAKAEVDWIVEDTTLTSDKYKVSAGYVSRIPVDTTVAEFKNNVTCSEELTIQDKDGNVLQDGDKLATGMKLKAGEEKEYTLVLIGDINGDGKITITDLVQLKLFTVNLRTPNVVQKMAADMNGDGKISITDLVKLNLKLVHLEE